MAPALHPDEIEPAGDSCSLAWKEQWAIGGTFPSLEPISGCGELASEG